MNLTTRCPSCKTVYKVVPDQLKISNGWVRCGRCAEVFDASSNLVSEGSAHAKHEKNTTTSPKDRPQPDVSPKLKIQQSPYQSSLTPIKKITQQSTQTHVNKNVGAEIPSTHNVSHAVQDVSDLAFVKDANRKAFWQQATTIRLTVLSLFVFALLFAFQVTYDQRHHLAAKSSALHHALTAVCEYLNCIIQPDMQIDALKIDFSSFQKVQSTKDAEISELKVSIKNTAASPIAAPALELSLTDANDKAVLKRVLSVKELNLKEPALAAMSESQITVRLLISASISTPYEKSPITGYRVLAFYP